MSGAVRRVLAALALASVAGSSLSFADEVGGAPEGEPVAVSPPAGEAGAGAAPSATPPPPGRAEAPRGDRMRAYHEAMAKRRLGSQEAVRERLGERVAGAEALVSAGRYDEAIATLTDIVEHPRFASSADTPEGRAAAYLLGDALASAGVTESARAYLRRALSASGAWERDAPYARRAARRLVEIALDARAYDSGLEDLASVPASAPPEVRAEIAYLRGRAREAAGDAAAALAAYAEVPPTSRFWSQATYLSGLIQVERGRAKEGEDLLCKVADPKRQDRSAPVFADERFFAVRDLARLALGRVAHEQLRHDDARYYYHLVPSDSDRLAEALYEAATTRYEKKDYEGARSLLDELGALGVRHRYEDEARILDAYIDLALCRFPAADAKLDRFLREYEPTRDAARRLALSEGGTRALLAAARTSADAAGIEAAGASVTADQLRAVAALVRVDPAYGVITKKRAVLDREASGLRMTLGMITDIERSLSTTGGVRPAIEEAADPLETARAARAAVDGVRRQLDDLHAARAPADALAPLRSELAAIEAELGAAPAARATSASAPGAELDLPDLLRADGALGAALAGELASVRAELAAAESALAKDALRRLDLRLSRLLRRARLGRIESVLGKKRALEIEIEAIHAGYLPRDAVDSLNAARYLEDDEEYWPFEGDDWPDEYVGTEGLR